MPRERYFQWMRIWKFFASTEHTPDLGRLYGLLDVLWQEERKGATPEQLMEDSAAWGRLEDTLDFANDPEYQAFLREIGAGEPN